MPLPCQNPEQVQLSLGSLHMWLIYLFKQDSNKYGSDYWWLWYTTLSHCTLISSRWWYWKIFIFPQVTKKSFFIVSFFWGSQHSLKREDRGLHNFPVLILLDAQKIWLVGVPRTEAVVHSHFTFRRCIRPTWRVWELENDKYKLPTHVIPKPNFVPLVHGLYRTLGRITQDESLGPGRGQLSLWRGKHPLQPTHPTPTPPQVTPLRCWLFCPSHFASQIWGMSLTIVADWVDRGLTNWFSSSVNHVLIRQHGSLIHYPKERAALFADVFHTIAVP